MKRLLKQLLLATVNVWDPLWIVAYRLKTGEIRPIPPFKNRDRIGARDISWFLLSGEADSLVIREAIQKWTNSVFSESAVLDLGSGCGRILLHFVADDLNLAASDVDDTAIHYVAQTFPDIEARVNSSKPPLSFPAERFDYIYAFSVFTHLPEELQLAWLEEAHRVLRPGGLLLVSTMGYNALGILREGGNPLELAWHTTTDTELKENGMIYHEYPIFSPDDELFTGISASYGLAVHDPDYIYRIWSRRFNVLEIRPGAFRGHQDLVVLQKLD